jgi:hypothetical protein
MSIQPTDLEQIVHRIEISGDLGRHAVEALKLEIRRLARRHGVQIAELRIETVDDEDEA